MSEYECYQYFEHDSRAVFALVLTCIYSGSVTQIKDDSAYYHLI